MKRLVVGLVGLLALFTFIRDYTGGTAAAQGSKPTVVTAQVSP